MAVAEIKVPPTKLVQAKLTEQEYQLLADYASKGEMTLQEALREAVRTLVLDDSVNPDDPVFTLPPGGRATGRKRAIAERHDELLYGRRGKR